MEPGPLAFSMHGLSDIKLFYPRITQTEFLNRFFFCKNSFISEKIRFGNSIYSKSNQAESRLNPNLCFLSQAMVRKIFRSALELVRWSFDLEVEGSNATKHLSFQDQQLITSNVLLPPPSPSRPHEVLIIAFEDYFE